MYYFAYGAHMNHQLMFDLCPGAKFIGEGELSNYMLIFDGYSPDSGGAIVNLERSREDAVSGGIFEITEAHLKTIDAEFGYPHYSSRTLMSIEYPRLDKHVEAWVYFHEPLADGMPSHQYINAMIQGARDCRLPETYIFGTIHPYVRISNRNKTL